MSKPLLELMLEHDVKWPSGAVSAVQQKDGGIGFTASAKVSLHYDDTVNQWFDRMSGWIKAEQITSLPLSCDYRSSIISRLDLINANAKQTPTEQILHDRGTTYGSFNDNARVSQEIKASIASGAGYDALSDRHKEALEFIAGKIARIVNGGNPDYADNWDDISGYALLGKKDEQCTL